MQGPWGPRGVVNICKSRDDPQIISQLLYVNGSITFITELAPNEPSTGIPQSVLEVVHTLGEGGPTGDLPPGKSLVFACLEVCLCLLVRRLPTLSPLKQEGTVGVIGVPKGLGIHGDTMLVKALAAMSELPTLTSPQGKPIYKQNKR